MGTQTMASQSGGSSSGQQSQIQSLARQGSLINLTLNEVQNHLGEPLHSMNLDDLLKSVFPAETNQPLSIDLDGASSQYSVNLSGLQRQGSITMPSSLSKKTVDEVWKGIQQGKEKGEVEQASSSHDRGFAYGEMTLEDFLAKAGVVAEGIAKDANDLMVNATAVGNVPAPVAGSQDFSQGGHWLQNYQPMGMDHHMQGHHGMMTTYVPGRSVLQPLAVCAAPILDSAFPDSPSLGALSDSQIPGRKRGATHDAEDKLVERRQKRMIKNRESAARSRARKQAYTNELENKIIRLEEENERLKKQQNRCPNGARTK